MHYLEFYAKSRKPSALDFAVSTQLVPEHHKQPQSNMSEPMRFNCLVCYQKVGQIAQSYRSSTDFLAGESQDRGKILKMNIETETNSISWICNSLIIMVLDSQNLWSSFMMESQLWPSEQEKNL